MWQIVINGPGYFDTPYDLPEGVTSLGRADENDIVLSGDLVSRRHARFHVRDSTLTVEDLGSRNGSRVNGEGLTGFRPLSVGDSVSVGENTLTVRQRTAVENAQTQLHVSEGGGVRLGERGQMGAILLSRDIRESSLLKMLDNVAPFDESALSAPPMQSAPIAYDSLFVLYAAAERLARSNSLQEFLDPVMDRLLARVNATTAVVLLKAANGALTPVTVRHRGRLAQGEVPVSDAVIEEALSKGTALVVTDANADQRFAKRESVVMYGVDQVLCVPFGPIEAPLGVLYLNKSGGAEQELSELLDFCVAVGHLIATGVSRFKRTTAGEERLREVLERFHAPQIVLRQVRELGGKAPRRALEERTVTVLFADVAGFSRLIQSASAERVTELLNEFYARMSGIVFSYEGTLDKFVGDAVMAVFGAPYSRPDDPLRAVRTAVAMRAEWDRTSQRWPEADRRRLRIGVNTGRALAGLVGSDARVDYTALGEAVNVASWLTASAEPGQVLITGRTLAAVGARFDVVPLGERVLRPKTDKVPVFEVVDEDLGSLTGSGR